MLGNKISTIADNFRSTTTSKAVYVLAFLVFRNSMIHDRKRACPERQALDLDR